MKSGRADGKYCKKAEIFYAVGSILHFFHVKALVFSKTLTAGSRREIIRPREMIE